MFDLKKYKSDVLNAALDYVRSGRRVIPFYSIDFETKQCTCGNAQCTRPGKHPVLNNVFQSAFHTEQAVLDFFNPEKTEHYNIACITGEIDCVVDIDRGVGKEGARHWEKILKTHNFGADFETLTCRTGGGGLHVHFKAERLFNKSGDNFFAKNIDFKANNAHVIMPPSLHQSGNHYEWLNNGFLTSKLALLPVCLTNLGKSLPTKKQSEKNALSFEFDVKNYAELQKMLSFVNKQDDRNWWLGVFWALSRASEQDVTCYEIACEWASCNFSQNASDLQKQQEEYFNQAPKRKNGWSVDTIVFEAVKNGYIAPKGLVGNAITADAFVYSCEENRFIYLPTGALWQTDAVNSRVSWVKNENFKKATDFIKATRAATSTCYLPAGEKLLEGVNFIDGGFKKNAGALCFNFYNPPKLQDGNAENAEPFILHVKNLMPKQSECGKYDYDQFLDYMAHRVQKPDEKPRFALLIAGEQGNGKDTAINFCVDAIGTQNVKNIHPTMLKESFKPWLKCVLLRINEIGDLGEQSKWEFAESIKNLVAGSPDVLDLNEKNKQQKQIVNYFGTILTTNHLKAGRVHLPRDDRRYDVIDTATHEEMGNADKSKRQRYFDNLHAWFINGGVWDVADFLMKRDLSRFNCNFARMTEAKQIAMDDSNEPDEWFIAALEFYAIQTLCGGIEGVLCFSRHQLKKLCTSKNLCNDKTFEMRFKLNIARAGYVRINNSNKNRWRIGGEYHYLFKPILTNELESIDWFKTHYSKFCAEW